MDYFNRARRGSVNQQNANDNNNNNINDNNGNPPQRPGARYILGAPNFENLRQPSTIRIRRLPSSNAVNPAARPSTMEGGTTPLPEEDTAITGRRRSSSAPQRPNLDALYDADISRQMTIDGANTRMPAITENSSMHPGFPTQDSRPVTPGSTVGDAAMRSPTRGGAAHSAAGVGNRPRNFGLNRFRSNTSSTFRHDRPESRHAPAHTDHNGREEYDSDVIDLLDLIDPEVRTIGTLTNLQNSLFVPDLGSLVNRRPTYDLSRRPTEGRIDTEELQRIARSRAGTRASRMTAPKHIPGESPTEQPTEGIELDEQEAKPRRTLSISSDLSDSHFAVLPHGVSLEGWHDEDVLELNDHVRHLLHSRREGFKRSMRGFRQYISKPLGLFVFVYATLVTLFGAAWVFCLIGWIYVGQRQDYFINVIDLVLVALFALIGDGLAPFRAVDTYHMCFIAHYHHLTWRLRREKALPELVDHNDLPDLRHSATAAEMEDAIDKEETAEYSVLSLRQQKRLQYHQAKFNKSHTFYKPHETATHHAFPVRLLVAVVVLLDCHSLLQVALGTCTWSIDYRVRPQALTATILSCSITCNILAGVVISIGDHKTRKKDVLERIFRQGLTEQALKRMAKTRDRGQMSIQVDRTRLPEGDIRDAVEKKSQSVSGPSVPAPAPENSKDFATTGPAVEKDKSEAFYTPKEL